VQKIVGHTPLAANAAHSPAPRMVSNLSKHAVGFGIGDKDGAGDVGAGKGASVGAAVGWVLGTAEGVAVGL
jgi:hypothetical protein